MNELEIKSFGAVEIKDAARGEVRAIVATLNVVDKDGDVILPGAAQVPNRVLLSAYDHDVILEGRPPVGKGVILEVDDKLVFEGTFFMATERGREHFETVKALGADSEWSFGFPKQVKTAELTDDWRAKGARRVIAGLVPVEASPVFRGAGRGTMTLTAKAEESLSDRMEAVYNALWARNEKVYEPWYAHEVFEEYVIVRAGARMLRVAYTIAEGGTVTLGEAVEVEVVYRPVSEKGADDGDVTKGEPKPPQADPSPDPQAEMKTKAAAAVEEFQRVQRTLKRLKVV